MTEAEKRPGAGNGAQAPDRGAAPMEKAPAARPPAPEEAKSAAGKTRGNGEGEPERALSMKEAKDILAEKHKAHVDADDALLMEVTLHQAFFGAYEKMLDHHRQAVRTVMEGATASAVKDIRQIVEELRSGTLESSLRSTLDGLAAEARQYEGHKAEMREWGGRLVFRQKLLAWLMLAINLLACLVWVASLYALKDTLQALP